MRRAAVAASVLVIPMLVCGVATSSASVPRTATRAAARTTTRTTARTTAGSVGALRSNARYPLQATASAARAAVRVTTVRAGSGTPVSAGSVGSSATSTEVALSGPSVAALARAARRVHARVVASAPGHVTAVVPASALHALSADPAVAAVRPPVRAYVESGPVSEGVAASNAGPASTSTSWQGSGIDGTGVDVGIVDAGFAGLADAVTAGDLSSGQTVAGNHCNDVDNTAHGTAVAEIVHQMAPGARLHLYCVDDLVGFAQAASELRAAGVRIVNSSLGFPGDSRGDGTGPGGSTAATVEAARKAGVLWVQAAGNSATDHWSGTFADANRDGAVDLNGTSDAAEYDAFTVPGTAEAGAGGGSAAIFLQWDQWPTSSAHVSLAVFGEQCNDADCDTRSQLNGGNPYVVDQVANTSPVIPFDASNTSVYPRNWYVYAVVDSGFPAVHYELSYQGDVSTARLAEGNPTRAAAGSIEEPASSPYALAVGAVDVGADGTARGTLEPYSSRGPTIDGRTKPDISGWDGVSSPVYGTTTSTSGGFFGTSAAAPHVAAAAALVKAEDPALDAAQIQNILEQRASGGTPHNPPDPGLGHGTLTLGVPSGISAPTGARYTSVTPRRVLDTRTTVGGHHGKVGAAGSVSFPISGLPADATAVAINLTGVRATVATHLTAYATGTALPPTSNLNLTATDQTAAVFAVITLNSSHAVTVRNSAGTLDLVADVEGYFGTGAEAGRYTSLSTPSRVLDTRGTVGGHHAPLRSGGTVTVTPGVPAGSTAAVVNITVTHDPASGHLIAAPTCSTATSTLNFLKYDRANLAVVGLTGSTPRFCITDVAGSADVIVDVVGYFGPSGAGYVALPSATRIVDTRTGNGGSARQAPSRALGAATATTFYGSNVGDVPADASALLAGVVEASDTAVGYLRLFPGTTVPSGAASTLNFGPGRVVANAAVTRLSGNTFGVYNAAGSTQAAIDVFGYFETAAG